MGSVTIELETPFITQDCCTRILRTIFELLLYNRGQIPFPYSTFRMLAKKLEADAVDPNSVASVQVNRQRETVQHVINCTELVLETLEKIMSNHPVSELMILLGKTVYTAKEAFIVKLPSADVNHFGKNHQRKLEQILQQIGLQLTLCDEIVTDTNLGDTNILVMVELSTLHEHQVGSRYGMNLSDDYQLPRKCVTYSINLKTTEDREYESSYTCCKRLKVHSEHTEQPAISADKQHESTTMEAAVKPHRFLLNTVVSGFSIKSAKHLKIWQ
ncbi:uncharacterized protein LOC128709041 [Anopheles marshallii]|uniref:uncharacterized protein LOC128709041 n=1 Tax=Anopheles marshallii TaxID=1521116 RepID=UPI00237B7552|nr:uncharacterized protein LOC128709041 [Anopheles marshallii]